MTAVSSFESARRKAPGRACARASKGLRTQGSPKTQTFQFLKNLSLFPRPSVQWWLGHLLTAHRGPRAPVADSDSGHLESLPRSQPSHKFVWLPGSRVPSPQPTKPRRRSVLHHRVGRIVSLVDRRSWASIKAEKPQEKKSSPEPKRIGAESNCRKTPHLPL